MQVTISHSNPDISHRESQYGQGMTEGDVFEGAPRSIWVAPDVIGESCQDCHSKTRNAKNECLVCNIEVYPDHHSSHNVAQYICRMWNVLTSVFVHVLGI